MQTATLPVRAEIEHTSSTSSNSTLKLVYATVISEGGYSLTGKHISIGQDPIAANQFTLTTAGTYYPVVSIRLNPDYKDTIVIPVDIALLPIKSAFYRYKLITGATITGGVWANASSTSSVQYNTNTSATISGGAEVYSSYVTSTVQAAGTINLPEGDFFRYQLERNSFTNTTSTFTLAVTCDTATSNVCGSVTWQEVN